MKNAKSRDCTRTLARRHRRFASVFVSENLPCTVWCSDMALACAVERSAGGPDRRVAAAKGNTSLAGLASSRTGGGAQQRFRIQFQGESVVEATDIRDALRQAEELGATEITAVARVEQ